jgi:ubiquinone/menaquinone biosynthesis C-methylase UbiE
MSSRFTEQETEQYYDSEDSIYRQVWDDTGSVHWGIFDSATGNDFLKACANHNRLMVQKARIGQDSKVLDMGCGNGTTAIWLSDDQKCHVTGMDLSGVRVNNAIQAQQDQPQELRDRLHFEKGSASEIPFPDASFTHIWSQAVIYHVPDKRAVLREAHRVLQPGGVLIFDDLVKPKADVGPDAQKYVYDRLLFDTEFSFDSYQAALMAQGFTILEATDLSAHLKTSYLCLAERTPKNGGEHADHYQWLSTAYKETARAVDTGGIGWGLFVCQK